jgi:hypothetical protein
MTDPKPGTQKAVVLEALKQAAQYRGCVTARQANLHLHMGQLPARIGELRRDHGIEIESEIVRVPSIWGKSPVAGYWLAGYRPANVKVAVRAAGNGRSAPAATMPRQCLLALTTVRCLRCGGAIGSDHVREARGKYRIEADCEFCHLTQAMKVVGGAVASAKIVKEGGR